MRRRPDWNVEGRDWPNRAASRFLTVGRIVWHVQVMGQEPVANRPALLLLHGTGAASHSWRDVAPLLAKDFTIVAPDLPGHGFTRVPPGFLASLPNMARAIEALLAALAITPVGIVGHSAGAAIGLRMALDGPTIPACVVSLSGALVPFPGVASILFPALAKLIFLNPFAAPILAYQASSSAAVARLLTGTGSQIDAKGVELYGRLLGTESHIAATLGMMANWDLRPLVQDLPKLSARLVLVTADRDRAVPPSVAAEIKRRVPAADIVALAGVGHLAHEERPVEAADLIRRALFARAEG